MLKSKMENTRNSTTEQEMLKSKLIIFTAFNCPSNHGTGSIGNRMIHIFFIEHRKKYCSNHKTCKMILQKIVYGMAKCTKSLNRQ